MKEHYLEVAKDENKCKCSLAVRLLGEGCRYCQPQEYIDKMSEWLDEERKNLSEANARIVMMTEALQEIAERNCVDITRNEPYKSALYASAESVSEWEASKEDEIAERCASWRCHECKEHEHKDRIASLQGQVSMLAAKAAAALGAHDSLPDSISGDTSVQKLEAKMELQRKAVIELREALANTKATAEAYDKEHAAKALEEAARYFESVNDQFTNPDRCVEKTLYQMAAELRAEAQKGSE